LARTAQGHLRKAHAHDGKLLDAHVRRRVLLGEQRDLARRVLVLAEEFDGLAPGGFLHAVEFAQVENVALDDALVGQPTIFHDTPIEMLLAILATFGTTQKHDGVGSIAKKSRLGREWVCTTSPLAQQTGEKQGVSTRRRVENSGFHPPVRQVH
jgi:hypothetical protein